MYISSLLCLSKYNGIFKMMEEEHDRYVWKAKNGDYREKLFFSPRDSSEKEKKFEVKVLNARQTVVYVERRMSKIN